MDFAVGIFRDNPFILLSKTKGMPPAKFREASMM